MIKIEKYTTGTYSRPDSLNTDPLQKGDSYDMSHCQYFYHKWVTGGAAWNFDYRNTIADNRAYWRGDQDRNQYKSFLYGNNKNKRGDFAPDGTDIRSLDNSLSKEAKRSALANLDWSIVSPAPFIRNSLQGMFLESDRRIKVRMTDANSMSQEEKNKWELWAKKHMKQYLDQMYANMGTENPQQAVELPTSMEELETMEFNGHFRLNYAKEAQKLISHTEDISEYEDLHEKFIDDLCTAGFAMARTNCTTPDGKAKYEYVDVENACIQYSRHNDFNNAEWGFEVRLYTMSELSDMGIGTKELKEIAQKYNGKLGNPYVESLNITLQEDDLWGAKAPVLVSAWKDIDVKKQIKYTRKRMPNRWFYKDVDFDFEEDKLKEREELIVTRVKKVRECKWIIDTDYVFDNGIMNYMVREDIKEPELPFRAVRISDVPLINQIKPFLDDFQISWLWYLNAKSHMRPYGIQVNFDLLKGIATEKGNLGELEAIEMMMTKGILPVSLINSDYIPGTTTDQAVREIGGGMGNALNEIMIQLNFNIQMISNVTGINIQSLSAEPNEGQNPALDTKELTGMSNSLKGIIDKTVKLKERLSKYVLQYIMLLIKYDSNSRKAYTNVIGDTGVSLLKEACANGAKMGAYTDSKPMAQDRREIMELVDKALQVGRDGQKEIGLDDSIYVKEMIDKNADTSELRRYITIKIRQREQEAQERQALNVQQNAQMQQEAEAVKAQSQMQVISRELDRDMILQNNKYEHEKELERIRNGYDDRNNRKRDLPPPAPENE